MPFPSKNHAPHKTLLERGSWFGYHCIGPLMEILLLSLPHTRQEKFGKSAFTPLPAADIQQVARNEW